MLRSLSTAGLMLVLGACPKVPETPPTPFVIAVFDPTAARIPLPNDLVFFSTNLNSVCSGTAATAPPTTPACAQSELLTNFAGQFPNDQEVPITIDFIQTNFEQNGDTTDAAPDLDLTSLKSSTFFVVSLAASGPTEVQMETPVASDYVKAADHGTLTLHRKGRLPWAGGSYAVLMRGGTDGVKTKDGIPVSASQVFHFVAQGLDMTDPKNLGLLRAQAGSLEAAIEQGEQLNMLILLYKLGAFQAADTRFPHQQLAIAATFKITPVNNVPVDPARSLVPLPIDLLRDPTNGRLTDLAACTLAGVPLAANGTCANPAAAGFKALDGFSTTGAILAQTSDLVQASSLTPSSVRLYDLSVPTAPVQVNPTTLIIEPCEFTTACPSTTALSPVIAIQPAGATAGDPTSVFRTKPLKDRTDYAVVITTDVKDKNGNALGKSTVGTVLGFTNPVSVNGKSALLGIDDATAAGLEKMRLQLKPVYAALATAGVPQSKVAMAYTFRTQTILDQAVQLAAFPYSPLLPAATGFPIAPTFVFESVDAAFTKFGVDKTRVPGAGGTDNINEILEVDIVTFNALDPLTGAFLQNPAGAAAEPIHVMIATPKTTPAACAFNAALKCAPMMVFRHGLSSGRADMLTVADSYAKAGMVTVAIDAAKHGDRSFCTSGTTGAASGCVGGAACTTTLPPGAQGDLNPPGTCGAAGFIKRPVSPTCTGQCATDATDGIPLPLVASGNYFISANFFRTRDTMRQDLIDQSQLVRVLAFVPTGAPHAVFDRMAGQGLVIDPAKVFFSGQSLGAIQGVMDVATNPRISKAAFNVGGGTIVDIFTNSPAFTATVDQLLAGLGIQRGTARFLQFLVVAKTILDPADPINFAGHLTANTLPNLLANPNGSVAQAPKKILAQIANCDGVVPNPFSLVNASNVPTGPLPTGAAFFAPGARGTFQLYVSTGFNPAAFGTCSSGVVGHAFLTDWSSAARAAAAQDDLANFVVSDTLPLSVQLQ